MRVLHVTRQTAKPSHLSAAFRGGATALAWAVITCHAHSITKQDLSQFDLAFIEGLGTETPKLVASLRAHGIECLIPELGYIHRSTTKYGVAEGYYQLSWNKIGWIPNCACPSDRFNVLNEAIQLMPDREDYVLVIGQKFSDTQHGMTATQVQTWCKQAVEAVKLASDLPVLFRPHPHSIWKLAGCRNQNPVKKTLRDAVKHAHSMVTYNSTSAVDAILAGSRLFCAASSIYHEMSSGSIADISTAEAAPLPTRQAFLHRLAYAQWTINEIQTGEALESVFSNRPKTDHLIGAQS